MTGLRDTDVAAGTTPPGSLNAAPVSGSHDWLYHPNMNGWGIVECRRCGKFEKYLLSGYKPEPPKEACYGRA